MEFSRLQAKPPLWLIIPCTAVIKVEDLIREIESKGKMVRSLEKAIAASEEDTKLFRSKLGEFEDDA